MRKKHVQEGTVRSIEDLDLSNPLHLRICIQEWNTIQSLSEQHLKVKDLFIELEDRWNKSNLSQHQRDSIQLYLIEGYTQREAGEMLNVGIRSVAKSVEEGIELMASYGENNG